MLLFWSTFGWLSSFSINFLKMSFNNDFLSSKFKNLKFNAKLAFNRLKSSLEQVRVKIQDVVSGKKNNSVSESKEEKTSKASDKS